MQQGSSPVESTADINRHPHLYENLEMKQTKMNWQAITNMNNMQMLIAEEVSDQYCLIGITFVLVYTRPFKRILATRSTLPATLAATASCNVFVTYNMSDGLSIPIVYKISK